MMCGRLRLSLGFFLLLGRIHTLLGWSTTSLSSPSCVFAHQVTEWLDKENINHEPITLKLEDDAVVPRPALCLGNNFVLHLLATPQSLRECTRPSYTARLNEKYSDLSIVHLRQDVWEAKRSIVKGRIRARCGKLSSRHFARKTVAKRITANEYVPFLTQHHLWSSTKAKCAYGLFEQTNKGASSSEKQQGDLLAVATFSARRHVHRNGVKHKSHELIRCCSQRNGHVVGGISKLIKAFVTDYEPDDIVTVIDRDWGSGMSWNAANFCHVQQMPPLPMVVSQIDGRRRHLVGAGIVATNDDEVETTLARGQRPGLPLYLLDQLNAIGSSSNGTWRNVAQCLASHGYFPIYDTGVQRLMTCCNRLPNQIAPSVTELWNCSYPTYANEYYSNNAGIDLLLRHAESDFYQNPLDNVRPTLPSFQMNTKEY